MIPLQKIYGLPCAVVRLSMLGVILLSGCAIDPASSGGVLSSNAGKAYIYTPEEQASMSESGTIPTMLTPSELKAYFSRKAVKPTGEVNYCDAGLSVLVQSRRNEALAAIDHACGKNQYAITHEGFGNVKARYLGNIQLTPGCARSKVIIFRCTGGHQPKPDMGK